MWPAMVCDWNLDKKPHVGGSASLLKGVDGATGAVDPAFQVADRSSLKDLPCPDPSFTQRAV